uniref:hypothetical protein n=1 Tax=Lentilactobacillus hilgardii TaxID=1588 RepID=UPI00403FB73A
MKKLLISVVTTVAVLIGFVCFGSAQSASAKAIPENMRGIWYSYIGHGRYFRQTMTKHRLYSRDYFEGKYRYNRAKVSATGYSRGSWLSIYVINKQTIGAPAFYRYSPIKIKGRWRKSLQFREGSIYYRLFKVRIKNNFSKNVTPWY